MKKLQIAMSKKSTFITNPYRLRFGMQKMRDGPVSELPDTCKAGEGYYLRAGPNEGSCPYRG